jgi:putative transposase
MKFFSATDSVKITQRRLPHWAQAGTVTFITWRTRDSMPAPVVEKWHQERDEWLRQHSIDPSIESWKAKLEELSSEDIEEFHETFTTRWHDELDHCHGACVLRRPALSRIVRDSLLYFDGDRYDMHGFVVMPNHVHVLVAFENEDAMLPQCESWKHFMASRLNAVLENKGRFWQEDAFDHLVRHGAQYLRLQRYLAENPVKARLLAGEYVLYQKTGSETLEK